ncbi:MAG: TetR family transcriptional regulator C-terminal domain-containing protein [Micropruina sp.]|uniref:TetR/AcrR family transcriptional regulator n=1 Tax=Micropruina sp. TaxID=2737536 RepID=UPI0039E341B9
MVDHRQRRDELIDVVWRLIVEDGLAGITIRRVAERSGWSSGAVRHYLPTREAILDAAAQRVAELIEERIKAVDASAPPLDALVAVLAAVLPTDEQIQRASLVWLAFVGQAASDAGLADAQGILYRDLNQLLVELLTMLAAMGFQVDGGPASAAVELQAMLDGLTVHVLLGRVDADAAQEVLRAAVNRLLTRPPEADG